MLISAEAMPFELFEDICTQQEAREKPELLQRKDIIVDDNLGFAKVRGEGSMAGGGEVWEGRRDLWG
jgi:hypothetical protein